MTEDHEIKALRKDMEHLRDTVFGNGDKHGMNVVLQRIEDGLNRNTDALSKLVDRVGQQNHRIEKLEHENVRQDAKREERLVWEQKEAGKREKEATRTLDGKWVRAYGFADGHSEIHAAPDGRFEEWEKARTGANTTP